MENMTLEELSICNRNIPIRHCDGRFGGKTSAVLYLLETKQGAGAGENFLFGFDLLAVSILQF